MSTVLQSCEAEGAPGPSEALGGLAVPQIQQLARESLAGGLVRLQLRLDLPREGMFGALAFDGPLVSWSFGKGRSDPWQGTKVHFFTKDLLTKSSSMVGWYIFMYVCMFRFFSVFFPLPWCVLAERVNPVVHL